MDVPWERRGQFDVGHAEQLHEQAFGADGETSVRRHAILEGLQVIIKWLRWQFRLLQCRNIILVAMQTLPARDQFGAPENQVERVGVLRPLRVEVGIEWTLARRVARDVEEIAAKFLFRPLAQPAFVLRRQVRLTTHIHAMQFQDQLLSVGKMNMRYLRWHLRHLGAQEIQFCAILLAQGAQNPGNDIAQHGHDGEMVLDKTKFGVQADIFVDVTCAVVRLCSEDRADLEDALEDAYHDLLVELWTLRQVGRSPEVVKLEGVGSALRGGCDQFGRLNLGKASGEQGAAKSRHRASREP